MRWRLGHEVPGRLRLVVEERLDFATAEEQVERAALSVAGVRSARLESRTGSLVVHHDGAAATRAELLRTLSEERLERAPPARRAVATPEAALRERRDALVRSVVVSFASGALPPLLRAGLTLARSLPLLGLGARRLAEGRLESDVLDAAAVGTALGMEDWGTAGSISLLLQLGDYIRARTESHARSDLAAVLERQERRVWVRREGREEELDAREVRAGDTVVVRGGHVVPVDGQVVAGLALVDQASLTGESLPVTKRPGARVYEGTRLVEGALDVEALQVGDDTRFAQVLRLVQQAEGEKAQVQARADRLADRLVPWVFGMAGLTQLATGDPRRAASVLLVDYSCALKLSVPIAIRTCMAEALRSGVVVRGGKFVEALAGVDTVVLDKTGTLTQARPRVVDLVTFEGFEPARLLRDTACVEEHFPHPFAAAILQEAQARGLTHREELHGEVKYLVAQGIVSQLGGQRFVVGSRRFLAECGVRVEADREVDLAGYSSVHVGVGERLAGIVRLEDPVRPEAPEALAMLRAQGVRRIVLMTGDSHSNARRVAEGLGLDAWHAELAPEDKVRLVRELQAGGGHVAMVGDGVNDTAALAAAQVGVSFQHGADLAKEVADVLILREDLRLLPLAIRLARRALGRVDSNFGLIGGINTALIALGSVGLVPPALSAVLHNGATVLTSLRSLRPYLEPTPLRALGSNVGDMLRPPRRSPRGGGARR